jgi:hypothetical protein
LITNTLAKSVCCAEGSRIAWPRTGVSAFDDRDRFVLARLGSGRYASGALVVRERGGECPLLAKSGHQAAQSKKAPAVRPRPFRSDVARNRVCLRLHKRRLDAG